MQQEHDLAMLPPRLARRTVLDPETGCWAWVGPPQRNGYGRLDAWLIHRLSYTALIGPIPDGLTIDHLCRNKVCVNPAHLEPVTQGENKRRAVAHMLSTSTRYPCGHERTEANTITKRKPKQLNRTCRECKNRSERERRRKVAAK